jgi:hypothetical protein
MDRPKSLPTSMNHSAIVEERDSKRNLIHEGSDLLSGYGWLVIEHVEYVPEIRPSDLQHQHIMFPIRTLDLEMIQGNEDTIRSRMHP